MSSAAAVRIPVGQACAARSGFRPSAFAAPAPDRPAIDLAGAGDRFEEGYAAGIAEGRSQLARYREEVGLMLASAEALQPEASDELAAMIAETVECLVRQIVEASPVTRQCILQQATNAAAIIADCDAARTIRLHPDDIALIDGVALPLEILPDATAERGSVRIDCSAGWVEAGRSLYLDALRATLGQGERAA